MKLTGYIWIALWKTFTLQVCTSINSILVLIIKKQPETNKTKNSWLHSTDWILTIKNKSNKTLGLAPKWVCLHCVASPTEWTRYTYPWQATTHHQLSLPHETCTHSYTTSNPFAKAQASPSPTPSPPPPLPSSPPPSALHHPSPPSTSPRPPSRPLQSAAPASILHHRSATVLHRLSDRSNNNFEVSEN